MFAQILSGVYCPLKHFIFSLENTKTEITNYDIMFAQILSGVYCPLKHFIFSLENLLYRDSLQRMFFS